jgi:hypothetical protein
VDDRAIVWSKNQANQVPKTEKFLPLPIKSCFFLINSSPMHRSRIPIVVTTALNSQDDLMHLQASSTHTFVEKYGQEVASERCEEWM